MIEENPAMYFRQYRESLGFSNQATARAYLAAKDLVAGIDYAYIDSLNDRIRDILSKVNNAVHPSCQRADIKTFQKKTIFSTYEVIRSAGILPRLNNQGRRPEEVLFSWLRGLAISEYFTPAISTLFSLPINSIVQIGEDDLRSPETFKRGPRADLELRQQGKTLRIEVQSGFQGINDIKEHKVREARRVFSEQGFRTVCIHFDLYNGQTAFVQLENIAEDDVNWVTRQQMEGQSVFSIEQNYFKWRLLSPIPSFEDIEVSW